MKYCTKCLQPDTRPNEKFSIEGTCSACVKKYSNTNFEWRYKEKLLKSLVSNIRKKTKLSGEFNKKYDCLIGVSGGKDSTRQALWVREKLGLNPLLICLTYPPEQVTERGVYNTSNLVDLDFDLIVSGPAPETWKLLMRTAFLNFGNWCRSTELALYSSVPQIAQKFKIPYIFIGENQNFRDPLTQTEDGWKYNQLINQNTLQGGDISWILREGLKESEIIPYIYPLNCEYMKNEVQIIDLGWFIKDWSNIENSKFASLHGISIRNDASDHIGDILKTSALDENFVVVNQMIKYLKYGFGKVSDQVNEDIRNGKMDRQTGIDLITKFDGKCSAVIIDEFINYLGISDLQFTNTLNKFVNPDLFIFTESGEFKPKFEVGSGIIK